MAKMTSKKQQEKDEAYLENYAVQLKHLYYLSRFNVRQFLGTRPEGDPRVEYLADLERFKNLVNAQMLGINRILKIMLGEKKTQFMKIMEEELATQLKNMEEDIGVEGWGDDGVPRFNKQVQIEKTKGWPE